MTALQDFLNSAAGGALIGMVGVAFADFATGAFAALRDGTFALDALAAFLRKHIWGRVAPIGTLLALGYFGGGTMGSLFLAAATAAAVAYSAETAASILGNISPPNPSEEVATPQQTSALVTNPVPQD